MKKPYIYYRLIVRFLIGFDFLFIMRDLFQTSLIISLALSRIAWEEIVLYIMRMLVDWHIKEQ